MHLFLIFNKKKREGTFMENQLEEKLVNAGADCEWDQYGIKPKQNGKGSADQ